MTAVALSTAERKAIEKALHNERHFEWAGLITSRAVPKRRMLRMVEKGLFREADSLVVVCDGDGCALVPERYRIGYELTDEGRSALRVGEDGGPK